MMAFARLHIFWLFCSFALSGAVFQILRGAEILRVASNGKEAGEVAAPAAAVSADQSDTADARNISGAEISREASQGREASEEVVAAVPAGGMSNDAIVQEKENIAELPAAIRPSNFTGCCSHLIKNLKLIGKHSHATCHTEQACENNTLYPFRSEEEKIFLERHYPNAASHRRICREAANGLEPEVTWCKIKPRGNRKTGNLPIPESFYPTGCSHWGMGGGSGPYDRLLLFPTYKLAFCGIPKSGISRWLQFLRFTNGARDYQDAPYYKADHMPFMFDGCHPDRKFEIYNDPNWTRALLIREPTERLLSGFLDKILPSDDFNFTTLEQFVEFLEQPPKDVNARGQKSGLTWHSDPHWRPQAWSCGLVQMLPSFQFVGGLDYVAEHTRAILEKVGLWESYGKHYRLSPKKKQYNNLPPDVSQVNATGFQQSHGNHDHHSRGASSKINEYFTPELLERVRKLYWMDYALWDAVQEAGPDQHHGKVIAAILNPNECSESGQQLLAA